MVRERVNAEEHAVEMLSELRRMQRDCVDCDLLIKVENDVYRTHRSVMSAGSTYIRDMLANKTHTPWQLCFAKQDSQCVKSCIDFIYSGELEIPDGKIANVLNIGTILRLGGVKRLIAEILDESLDVGNYFSTRNMADKYGLKEVSVKCEQFVKENLMEIANQPEFGRTTITEIVDILLTKEGKFTEHDKLVVLLKWAEKNQSKTYVLLEQIQRIRLDHVPPVFLRNLLKSHPVVSNDFATYKLISDHLLEISEKLLEGNESYRSGQETTSQDQRNSSDVGNTYNDNNSQSHAVVVKDEQLDTVALPAIPHVQTLHDRRHVPKRNVLSEYNPVFSVVLPSKRRKSCAQNCSTPKVERLNANCPNKALTEALTNLLVNKTPDDIAIDHEGFAYVKDILKHRRFRRFSLSEKYVYDLVTNSIESRFAIKGKVGNFKIQATCGHLPDSETGSVDEDGLNSDCRVTVSVPDRHGIADS